MAAFSTAAADVLRAGEAWRACVRVVSCRPSVRSVDAHCAHTGCCGLVCLHLHAGTNALQAAAAAAAAAAEEDAPNPAGTVAAADFAAALQRVGPSIVRGAAVEVSPVSWEDVGGYGSIKRRLQQAVEWPLQHAGVRVCAAVGLLAVAWHALQTSISMLPPCSLRVAPQMPSAAWACSHPAVCCCMAPRAAARPCWRAQPQQAARQHSSLCPAHR
jgi:hypothetical protein